MNNNDNGQNPQYDNVPNNMTNQVTNTYFNQPVNNNTTFQPNDNPPVMPQNNIGVTPTNQPVAGNNVAPMPNANNNYVETPPNYINEQLAKHDIETNKKNTIPITKELKTVIIIALVLLVFIIFMPILTDLLNNVRFH